MERLYGEAELARFYDMRGMDRDDFTFCRKLAQDAASILDLGCGTGALAAELAAERMVVGVDPASAMLDIARARPGGDRVRWLDGDARSVRLDQRFDLIVMTGHSFQVFLEEKDQSAVFQTIAAHLQPAGRFVFDSRNPDFPGRKTRSRDETLHLDEHPQLGMVEAWNESAYDDARGILTYENGYRILRTGEVFSASARIRYTPRHVLARLMGEAGLVVDEWLGDWTGAVFHQRSREIIPVGRLAGP